jgi:hypothetical protein
MHIPITPRRIFDPLPPIHSQGDINENESQYQYDMAPSREGGICFRWGGDAFPDILRHSRSSL